MPFARLPISTWRGCYDPPRRDRPLCGVATGPWCALHHQCRRLVPILQECPRAGVLRCGDGERGSSLPCRDPARSPGGAPVSTVPSPGSTAMQSAAVMPPGRRCRRRMKSRERQHQRRLTSSPVRNCSACSKPSISAEDVPAASMPIPSGHSS